MALVRGCHRCGTGIPIVTRVQASPDVLVEIRLCQPCRHQAAAESAAAWARRTSTETIPEVP